MEITSDQRSAWKVREENVKFEAVIGPVYKRGGGAVDIEALLLVAELNGLADARDKYQGLNPGQIAMNVRNRLRPLWRNGLLKLSR